ncbi:MAG TPA: acyloxyacyl hydrolase [Pyrinomonadaceae bacterium]|nr:acyloxyacyl hydrolase [Pyrinomonadaceae bacterium]
MLWLIILIFSFTFAQAQNTTDSNNSTGDIEKETNSISQQTGYFRKRNEIGFWGGSSTVHKDLVGASAGGNFVFGAFRFSRSFKDGESVKLKYFLDVIPAAVLNYPRERMFQTTPTLVVDRRRQTVYGFGFAPGGLQVNLRNRKKYQPFLAGSLGFMYFTKVVVDNRTPLNPQATGAKLNYTAELSGGLKIRLKNDKNFFVGYKYYHISNLYTGNINIGFNANMVYAGMNFGR